MPAAGDRWRMAMTREDRVDHNLNAQRARLVLVLMMLIGCLGIGYLIVKSVNQMAADQQRKMDELNQELRQ